MRIEARYIVAACLLVFAWKGESLEMPWPPAFTQAVVTPKPSAEVAKWADAVRAMAPKMLPGDRAYLADFYEGMAFVLLRDFDREKPIIVTSDGFEAFHGGSLKMAIEKAKVGIYPGLDEAIDKAFFAAIGDEPKTLTPEDQKNLVAACGSLTYTLRVGRDE